MIETSVIIPIWEKTKYLRKCLASLVNQSSKNIEIIVVDDGSREVVGIQLQVSNILQKLDYQFLKQAHLGPAMARNLGARKARGKILVFVDSDMIFDKNFIKELIKPIKEEKTKGIFSSEEYVANWKNHWARCWNYNFGLKTKRRIPQNYPEESIVFRAILRSEFLRVGGFEATGYNDDWTLSRKLGYKSKLTKQAIYYHYNPANLKEVFDQARWRVKREYKFGFLGDIVQLTKSFLPISFCKGLIGMFYWKEPAFFIFTLVFDAGAFLGLIQKNLFKNYY